MSARRAFRIAAGAAAVTAALAAAAPSPAAAFARMTTPEGVPLFWPSTCAYFTIDSAGSDDVEISLLASVIVGSFNAWASVPESYITFQYNGLEADTEAGWLGGGPDEDVIRWVETDWRNVADPENARPSGVIALTTVSFARTGEIRGADMELNGEDFTFTVTNDVTLVDFDVANTITHEAGHFVGIHHNCFEIGSGLDPGQAVDCGADPILREATMYWSADQGELMKRSLEPDDIAAVAAVYPLAGDPGRCEEPGWLPDGGGNGYCNCAAVGASRAGTGAGAAALLLGAGLAGLGAAARHRRRTPDRPPQPRETA